MLQKSLIVSAISTLLLENFWFCQLKDVAQQKSLMWFRNLNEVPIAGGSEGGETNWHNAQDSIEL